MRCLPAEHLYRLTAQHPCYIAVALIYCLMLVGQCSACALPSPPLPLSLPTAEHAHIAAVRHLLGWAQAADHCQLVELRLRCLSEVAHRLTSPVDDEPVKLAAAFADASLVVDACDTSLLAQLLGLVVAAGSSGRLPAPDAAVAALQQAGSHGMIEWVLERFSEQPNHVGDEVNSPWIAAAGRDWRFEISPGGISAESAGHLSGERGLGAGNGAWGPATCSYAVPVAPLSPTPPCRVELALATRCPS